MIAQPHEYERRAGAAAPRHGGYYREQVAALAEALSAEENRAEAADLLRSLIDRIELTPERKRQARNRPLR